MSIDTYTIKDFRVGDRVKAFHPGTFGTMHWATVEKVGRSKLTVVWHVTGKRGFVLPRNVGEFERD